MTPSTATQSEQAGIAEPRWYRHHIEVDGVGTDVLLSCDGVDPAPVEGERMHQLFEARCAALGDRASTHVALEYESTAFSYAELLDWSHAVADRLRRASIGPGRRVALLMDRSVFSPAAVLALSRLDATAVLLDAGFPPDRLRFMIEDSGASVIVTLERFVHLFAGAECPIVVLDQTPTAAASGIPTPAVDLSEAEPDPLSYIIYTSGTTGRPKGVGIRHSSICNFLRVASNAYGYLESDRVYQGMTIAFDFSVEELWVPLVAGATVVPAPADSSLVGPDLAEFLSSRSISALCCVPTLLTSIRPEDSDLRFLLVSGEACPVDVIEPWFAPRRRVLNAYGPTETTVTATWSVLEPGRPITIGGPLPTYAVLVLDPDDLGPVPAGRPGEIVLAGIGVADGYLGRPEQTAAAFVDDPYAVPGNPRGLLYRTGDLGRINDDDEIEYLGRIDTQVKIRGYRIELAEIEACIRRFDSVGAVVVHPYDAGQGTELVAYLVPSEIDRPIDLRSIDTALRSSLPPYMVPSFYEPIDSIPLLASTKADRSALPAPSSKRFVESHRPYRAPRSGLEATLAMLLGETLGIEAVSIDDDFFDDLSANSLSLASFVSALRRRLDVKRVTLKQLYQNSTVARLAASIEATVIRTATPSAPTAAERHGLPAHRPTRVAHALTGVAQATTYLLVLFVSSLAVIASYAWVDDASGPVATYLRAAGAGSALYFGGIASLVAVKWLAVGRLGTAPIALWSPRYVRFWIAKTAVLANPANLLAGSPLYNTYLRLLGARVGAGAVVFARPPACPDQITIGERALLRRDVVATGYTVVDGWVYPGPVTIGDDALVCDATVLDIDTTVGAGAQLGTSSALLEGGSVPAGSVAQGSPAEPSTTDFGALPASPGTERRRRRYVATQLAGTVLVTLPATMLVPHLVEGLAPELPGAGLAALGWLFGVAAIVYVAGLVTSAVATLVVPRVLRRAMRDNEVHPLFGAQYHLARGVQRFSNNLILNTIFGDSSMIVRWLSLVGYDLRRSTQTGSNFGVQQRHDSPFLCSFDRNTLVSDGLVLMNMETTATSFRLSSIAMPPDTYLGNLVHYPPDAAVGANCLIATKAAVPVTGDIRTDVGLLGSPAFAIPRSVTRDLVFDHYRQPGVLEDRLRRKLRSNVVTAGLYLLRSWLLTVIVIGSFVGAIAVVGSEASLVSLAAGAAVAGLGSVVASTVFSIAVERLIRGFRPLRPQYCSLYDGAFWEHERFWKLNYNAFLRLFDGTPFKPWFLRMQGARVGARVFDDGAGLTEPSLVAIGDDAMLNYGATLQCHSLEDGTFKSDHIVVADGVTIATMGFVHYGAVVGDRARIDADSFVMKGSIVAPDSVWHGNPAREVAAVDRPVPPTEFERLPS